MSAAYTIETLEDRALLSAGWSGMNGAGNDSPAVSPVWFETVGDFQSNAAWQTSQIVGGDSSMLGASNDEDIYDWIVQFRTDALDGISSVAETVQLLAGGPADFLIGRGLGLVGQVLVRSSGASLESVSHWFSTNTHVAAYELDLVRQFQVTPNDPSYGASLWGLENNGQWGGTEDADIDAASAWDMSTGSSDIVVGVIDTGVDYTHPDLAANMWQNPGEIAGNGIDDDGNGFIDDVYGYDFVNDDGDPMDDHNHGTHVAGTIAAVGNNGVGVVGVNWTSSIMALKFLDSNGFGSVSDGVRAVNYATMMRTDYGVNVRVTNNSWGGGGFSSALESSIQAGADADILFVAAAGNDRVNSDTQPHYPAAYNLDGIVSVAATDRNDNLASFSNYGTTSVDLAAPGVAIYSTVAGGGYASLSGTSMATPHVAGVAALAWSVHPNATLAQIRDALLEGTDTKTSLTGKTATGGRLNAHNTLERLGLNVAASTPGAGSVLNGPLTEFTIQFTHDHDDSTIDAADLTVNGVAADHATIIDARTVRFTFDATPVASEGPQVMRIAAEALQSTDGASIGEWRQTFFVDSVPLALDRATPGLNETVSGPPNEIVLVFNEAIDADSVAIGNLELSSGTVTGATGVGENAIRFTIDLMHEGDVEYALPAGMLRDAHGNPNAEIRGTFKIDDPFKERYAATGLPVKLPDGGVTSFPIEVPDSFVITDLDVEFDAIHEWDADLEVFLIAPDGTRIELFTDVGGNGHDFVGTVLDDEADLPITLGVAPFTGRFRPEGQLSSVDGLSTQGTWTLEVADDYSPSDTGSLTGWALIFTVLESPTITSPPVTDIDEDSAYHYHVTAEYDGELAVHATTLPNWLTLTDHGDGTATLAGTPENAHVGVHPVVLEVRAGNGTVAVQSFFVTVTNVNDAPTLSRPMADQSASVDWPFAFPLASDLFQDVDAGDVLSFTATLDGDTPLPAWLQFDPGTRTFSGTPSSSDTGSLDIHVTATDRHGASATGTFVLNVQPRLAAPDPLSVVGATFDVTPQFAWTAVEGAVRYDLWVNDQTTRQSGIIRNADISEAAFIPGTRLADGHRFIWTVRGIAADGAPGAWAPHRTFHIDTSLAPTPIGPDPRTIDTMPKFEWTEVPGAVRYDLWVNNVSTRQFGVIRNLHIGETSYTHETALPDGNLYVWTVRGFSADGTPSAWAPHRYFTIDTSVAPHAQSLAARMSTPDARPLFEWTPVPGAAHYDLWVNDLTTRQSGVIRNPHVGNPHWAPKTPLQVGHAYIWTVRGLTDEGLPGQWASHQIFYITTLKAPEILTPTSTTIDVTPTLRWTAVEGAVRYDVWVNDQTTGQYGVLRDLNVPQASLTPTAPFVDGHRYVWTVRGFSSDGTPGNWAAHRYFTVNTRTAPAFLAPATTASAPTPTFQWTAVEGAAHYELRINDLTTAQVQSHSLTATSWTADVIVGHWYRWTVRGITDDGKAGAWSPHHTFQASAAFNETFDAHSTTRAFDDDHSDRKDDPEVRSDGVDPAETADVAEGSPRVTMTSEQIDAVMADWPAFAWWRTAKRSA